jgi:hypothetical protein
MAHIKEPKGVDFVIESGTLTKKDKLEISQFIAAYKAKAAKKRAVRKKRKVQA